MLNSKKYKVLMIIGTVLILTIPLWWFVLPQYVSPLFCNPADYAPASGNYSPYGCSDVYVKVIVVGSFINLIAGGIFFYLASRNQQK